jgi:TIR domain
MPRDQVFISYSHQDRRWRATLDTHLKPYLRDGSITIWSDKQINPGSKWLGEIKAALTDTKVAVLLVTPNFLASPFIHENELYPLLKEAAKGGVRILWVPVRASSYKKTALKDYQAVLDNPDKPLANMKKFERDKAWVRICEEIEGAVNPRPKLERAVKQVEERQDRQEQEMNAIKIALKAILTKHELGPLQGLNGDKPVMMRYEPQLYGYLHRLDGLSFIQPHKNKRLKYGLFDIVEDHKHELELPPDKRLPFDLKKYVYITDEGRMYLETLNDLLKK